MESFAIYMPIILALIGLAYMLYKKSWVMKQDAGDGKMKEISDHIYEGALAFLNACLLYTSPSPRDRQKSRMPSSA